MHGVDCLLFFVTVTEVKIKYCINQHNIIIILMMLIRMQTFKKNRATNDHMLKHTTILLLLLLIFQKQRMTIMPTRASKMLSRGVTLSDHR